MEHNFDQSPLATVPFSLYVENCAPVTAAFYYKSDKDALITRNNNYEIGGVDNHQNGSYKILGIYQNLLFIITSSY